MSTAAVIEFCLWPLTAACAIAAGGRRAGSIILALSLCAVALAQQAAAPASGGTPVVIGRRTVFTIYTNLGPFSAQDRAVATSERLTRLARDLTASTETIAAVNTGTSTDITAGDRVLVTVTDADARAAGKSRTDLAAEDIASIRSAIVAVRAEYSSRSLLTGAAYTVLLTTALMFLLTLLRKSAGWRHCKTAASETSTDPHSEGRTYFRSTNQTILESGDQRTPLVPGTNGSIRVSTPGLELFPLDPGIRS